MSVTADQEMGGGYSQARVCSKQQRARDPVSNPDSWKVSAYTQGCSLVFVYGPAFTHTNIRAVARRHAHTHAYMRACEHAHTPYPQRKEKPKQWEAEMIWGWEPYRRVRMMAAKEVGCSEEGTKKVSTQHF